MKCRQASSLFNDHHDGALSAALATQLESHLASCGDCAAQYESLKLAVRALAIGEVEPTPPTHVDAIMTAVVADLQQRRENTRAERRRVAPLWLVVASHLAAAAIGAVLVWGLIQLRGMATNARSEPLGLSNSGAVANAANGRGGELGGDAGAGLDRGASNSGGAPNAVVAQAAETRFVFVPIALRVVQRAVQRVPPQEVAPRVTPRSIDPLELEGRRVRALGALATIGERGVRALEHLSMAATRTQMHTAELADLARAEAVRAEQDREAALAVALARAPEVPSSSINVEALAPRGAVVIARDSSGVVLSLRGGLDDVVPALINLLASTEPGVSGAVERRLVGFARELGVPPPRDTQRDSDSPWWRSDRGRAADVAWDDVDAALGSVDPSAWRAWWNSARAGAVAVL